MGQYQQWLHHREIDQLLRAQLETLENELLQLDERIEGLSQETLLTADNSIVQALLAQQLAQQTYAASSAASADRSEVNQSISNVPVDGSLPAKVSQAVAPETAENAGSVSSALFAWGSLPNFETQPPPAPVPALRKTAPDEDLLPNDMATFVTTHSQSMPPLKLPWWLRTSLYTNQKKTAQPQPPAVQEPQPSQPANAGGPVDLQSNRTNQLVQRWFERRQRFAQQSQERREQG